MAELNPGDKIKKLRMDLGLKQEDITNDMVSKSLISMIETNKRGLTWHVANIIAENLNKYYSNMGKEITPEYLMESEVDYVRREFKREKDYIYSIIDSGKFEPKLLEQLFEKLMKSVDKWDLDPEKMELIALRGRFYYKSYQYNEALKDLSTALEYYIAERNHSEVSRIYNLMGACYHLQMNLERALNYFEKSLCAAKHHNIENRARLEMEAIFNLILCYRKTKKYDMVFNYIAIYKELEAEHKLYDYYYNQVALLEANTYRELGNYERAARVYEKLIHKREDIDKNTLFLVYENFSTLCREAGKVEKALGYIKKANKLLENSVGIKPSYHPSILLAQAKCQLMLDLHKEAIQSLEKGLSLAKQISKSNTIIDFYFTLAQVYLMMKDYDRVLDYLGVAEKIIIEKDIKSKKNDLYTFYAEVYLELDKKEKCREYMTKNRQDYLAM